MQLCFCLKCFTRVELFVSALESHIWFFVKLWIIFAILDLSMSNPVLIFLYASLIVMFSLFLLLFSMMALVIVVFQILFTALVVTLLTYLNKTRSHVRQWKSILVSCSKTYFASQMLWTCLCGYCNCGSNLGRALTDAFGDSKWLWCYPLHYII